MGDIIEPVLPGAITDCYPLTVGVRRTATAPADAVRGRVLTLSNGGATISLDTKVTTRERVWLAFEQASAGVDFATAGAVTSVECSQAGHWNASVAFDDQLTTSELAPLQAALGEADQQSLRPIMGQAVADWGPGISPTIVQLRSISTGGFCMVSKQAETIDARFHLTIETVADNRFVIPARVLSQRKTDEGFEIVCEFLYSQGYHLMDAVFQANAPRRRRLDTFTAFSLAVMLLGFVCTALCVYMLLAH
jgi:PilZ domain